MRLQITVLLLVMAYATAAAPGYSQKISLAMKNAKLEAVFSQIEKISGYSFIYEKSLLKKMTKVDVSLHDASLQEAMDHILKDQPIEYNITDKYIVISPKKPDPAPAVVRPPANPDLPANIVAGVVKDTSGAPMPGVSVVNTTTGRGTSTNKEGIFKIEANPGDVLVFSSIGYEKRSITIGAETQVTVILKMAANPLNTIVVTALGVKRSAQSLTYATQTISSDEITDVKTDNLMNALNGKVAGVNIQPSAAGVGGSVKVSLRGIRSYAGNNQPLYVIDGIPMADPQNGSQPNDINGGSPDAGDGISNLNPEDIESITVLEGASAAALYGSGAANGVIVITTKKGKAGKTQINYSSSFQASNPVSEPKFQNQYGQTPEGYDNWGPAISGGSQNNLKDFFQTGTNFTNAISLSGGSETAQTYFSYANATATGIEPTNKLERNNFNIRETQKFLNNKLTVDASLNYIAQTIDNSPAIGGYRNPLPGLYSFPRGVDILPYKNQYAIPDPPGPDVQNWFIPISLNQSQNPWWVLHKNTDLLQRSRVIFNGSVKYEFNSWFNVQVRGSLDRTDDNYQQDIYAGTIKLFNQDLNGHMAYSTQTTEQQYGDVIAGFNAPKWGNFKLDGLVGAAINDTKINGIGFNGDLSIPNTFTTANLVAGENSGNGIYSYIQVQSLFASANLSYKNWAYLALTDREDWSSTLAITADDHYNYPSAGLSFILSQMFAVPKAISYAKIRGSIAELGNGISYGITNPQNTISANQSLVFNNSYLYNIKPENTVSAEVGTDWKFIDNRINFSFTYYDTHTKNQLFSISPPSATLIVAGYVTAGDIQNSGVEITLGADVVRGKTFNWNTSFTAFGNKNKILSVAPAEGLNSAVITGNDNGQFGYVSEIATGGSYGDIYGNTLYRNAQGQAVLAGTSASTYIPQITPGPGGASAAPVKVGNANPTFQSGWNNSFDFHHFNLSFLVDGKFGGKVLALTQAYMNAGGVSQASLGTAPNRMMTINGVNSAGQPVTSISAQNWYQNLTQITDQYMYSATVIRLRQAALGYTWPITNSKVKSVRLSLIGRNLIYFYKKAPFDPEVATSTGNGLSGIDYYNQPPTRNVGFTINVSF